jgi:hypothetical protein
MGEYMDQREDLHALRYPPGSVIPVHFPGLSDGVINEDERILDISASSPEQIIREALRVAMQRHDYAGIASLAAALHQITGEA